MEYQEIWENLTADKGDIVELYAEFEKQSKSAPPVSTLRTSFLKEFGTRATAKGLGGWAGLKVLSASNKTRDDLLESIKQTGFSAREATAALEDVGAAIEEIKNETVVKRAKKKLKKKIKKRAPKPALDTEKTPEETPSEEKTPGEIQQESFQEILSESETESGGILVGDDLDLSDVLGVEEEPEQELF